MHFEEVLGKYIFQLFTIYKESPSENFFFSNFFFQKIIKYPKPQYFFNFYFLAVKRVLAKSKLFNRFSIFSLENFWGVRKSLHAAWNDLRTPQNFYKEKIENPLDNLDSARTLLTAKKEKLKKYWGLGYLMIFWKKKFSKKKKIRKGIPHIW